MQSQSASSQKIPAVEGWFATRAYSTQYFFLLAARCVNQKRLRCAGTRRRFGLSNVCLAQRSRYGAARGAGPVGADDGKSRLRIVRVDREVHIPHDQHAHLALLARE